MPRLKKFGEFKVGQLVQFVPKPNTCHSALPGATAKVTSVDYMPQYLKIRWVKNSLEGTQFDGEYYPFDFSIQFKPIKPFLDSALALKRITNLEYLNLLAKVKTNEK